MEENIVTNAGAVKKGIVWNEVTWYSKLLSIIFFVGVLPALTFYVGIQYEKTTQSLNEFSAGKDTEAPITTSSLYRNEQYGFEIALPPGYVVETNKSDAAIFYVKGGNKNSNSWSGLRIEVSENKYGSLESNRLQDYLEDTVYKGPVAGRGTYVPMPVGHTIVKLPNLVRGLRAEYLPDDKPFAGEDYVIITDKYRFDIHINNIENSTVTKDMIASLRLLPSAGFTPGVLTEDNVRNIVATLYSVWQRVRERDDFVEWAGRADDNYFSPAPVHSSISFSVSTINFVNDLAIVSGTETLDECPNNQTNTERCPVGPVTKHVVRSRSFLVDVIIGQIQDPETGKALISTSK